MVLLSAQGMGVAVIAKVAFTSEDPVAALCANVRRIPRVWRSAKHASFTKASTLP